jgi:hypothetical protein
MVDQTRDFWEQKISEPQKIKKSTTTMRMTLSSYGRYATNKPPLPPTYCMH